MYMDIKTHRHKTMKRFPDEEFDKRQRRFNSSLARAFDTREIDFILFLFIFYLYPGDLRNVPN